MRAWRTAWLLAKKDLRLFLRDRTGLLLALALPLFLATIFASAMGGMTGGGKRSRVELLVEDLDASARSRALIAELEASGALRVEVASGVRKRVAEGDAPAALLVPSGYGEDLAAGRRPELRLYRDPAKEIEQQIVAGNLLAAAFRSSGPELARGAIERGLALLGFPAPGRAEARAVLEETFARLHGIASTAAFRGDAAGAVPVGSGSVRDLQPADALPSLAGIAVEDVAGPGGESRKLAAQSHAISGIAVMMLLFGLSAAGATLIEERAAGTLQRLQLAPSTGGAILGGKFLFCAISGAAQLVVLFAYGALLFDVPVTRAPLALALLSAAVVAAATSLGLVLAVWCGSRKQLEGLSTLVILAMSALGGSWFPLAFTPEWYQRLGHFTLNAWAMDGYQAIFWYGEGLSGVASEIGVLLAIAAGGAALASAGWRRRYSIG